MCFLIAIFFDTLLRGNQDDLRQDVAGPFAGREVCRRDPSAPPDSAGHYRMPRLRALRDEIADFDDVSRMNLVLTSNKD
ncbi:MAG TPA: hypothetical protein DDY20_10025 [Desulfobulbaceae bacterium]|nr:hypothetical protein [Desulfobulbaceae bacterium]